MQINSRFIHATVAFVVLLAFIHSVKAQSGSVSLGGACLYDENCNTPNSFCHSNRVCDCRIGFRKNNSNCYANVGALCSSNENCNTLQNSECRQFVCTCKPDYYGSPLGDKCLESVHYNQACQISEQCYKFLGNLSSSCFNNLCLCRINYHPASNGTCVLTKSLNEACRNNDDCYNGGIGDYGPQNDLICKDNKCSCRDGTKPLNDQLCKSSAYAIIHSLFFLLLMYIGTRCIS